MAISAELVKQLRERTGAGMMECKKALEATEGDIEAAVEHLRKTGLAKAEKKAGRTAADGVIEIRHSDDGRDAVMLEVNTETDFVAKEAGFRELADAIAKRILESKPSDTDALLQLPVSDSDERTIETAVKELVAKLGEKISVRRFVHYHSEEGTIGSYSHGGRIGALVEVSGGDAELAKNLAMHIAASRPVCISEEDAPSELVEKEKAVLRSQAEESGKPADIIEKMISGRLKKFFAEIALVGQPYVKDPDRSVGDLLKETGATVLRFERFEVGEGIEKETESFAEEVMAQAREH